MNSEIKAVSKIARNSLQIDLIKSLVIETQEIKKDIEKYKEFAFLKFYIIYYQREYFRLLT